MANEKKGMVNIYFIISITVFISLSIYIIFSMFSFYPSRAESIRINSLYSQAYTLSEFLVKDPGYPEDWNYTSIERLGLASVPYELNMTKIDGLRSFCDPLNYTTRNRLANISGLLQEYEIIKIDYLNGTNVLTCSPWGDIETNASYLTQRTAEVKRLAVIDNKTVLVDIYVG